MAREQVASMEVWHAYCRKSIGKKITKRRQYMRLSILDCGNATAISEKDWRDYERGIKSPTLDTLAVIGACLKIQPGQFLQGIKKCPLIKVALTAKHS